MSPVFFITQNADINKNRERLRAVPAEEKMKVLSFYIKTVRFLVAAAAAVVVAVIAAEAFASASVSEKEEKDNYSDNYNP